MGASSLAIYGSLITGFAVYSPKPFGFTFPINCWYKTYGPTVLVLVVPSFPYSDNYQYQAQHYQAFRVLITSSP